MYTMIASIWGTLVPILVFLWLFVFELEAHTAQRDGRTNEWAKTCNAVIRMAVQ